MAENPRPAPMPASVQIDQAQIDRRFDYHRPDAQAQRLHEIVRAAYKELAERLVGTVPAGREAALMITELETSLMWANAAIAREFDR